MPPYNKVDLPNHPNTTIHMYIYIYIYGHYLSGIWLGVDLRTYSELTLA